MRADDPKAQFRGEITSSELEAIRATCLFVATILGDYPPFANHRVSCDRRRWTCLCHQVGK